MNVELKVGDRIRIVNSRRSDYGKTAIITSSGARGTGFWIIVDGSSDDTYLPFGWERLK